MKDRIEVQLPAPGESVKEVFVSRLLVQEGDVVAKDALLCEIESDKATMEVVAPSAGKVHFKVSPQTAYPVGTVAVEIDTAFQPQAAPLNIQPPQQDPKNSKPMEPAPLAEKPVEEPKKGDLDQSHAVRQGMKEFLAQGEKPEKLSQQSVSSQPAVAREKERREPMSLIRKTIAKRLVDVKNETAMLTTFNEVDMSSLLRLRKEHQEAFTKKYGIKLGFMAFFTKAVERALKIYPKVNCRIDKDTIVHPDGIHVGIAVSTDRGLVVPVVRHVENMSLSDIEKEIAALAAKGREGKLTVKDFEGGSFTITNGGVFGSLLSTPILNPPQSGILGMHATVERPVAVSGKVEIRPMMYIALSYDHRIVDGKEAVGFLVEVKRWIENPEIGVLGL
jgi:2-oxoglutarate dehydrogenase E2 component (dihydrolipoamide succinyltransferase)